jgi:arabinofuranan 3-O-arabinosyltransferase
MSDDQPLVSVIIPTRNAGKIIGRCLESIRSQSYRSLEIIVVDNYSSDETRRVVEKYRAKFITAGPPPPYNNFFTAPIQRRVGAEQAKGAFLFFVDADMILSRGLIEECVKRCEEGADAVTIQEISFGTGFWAKCKEIERACYINDPRMEAPRFIRKSTYEYVGGWSEKVGAFDDWDLAKQLRTYNLRIERCINNYILHNEGYLTLRSLFLKKYRMGRTIDLAIYISGQNLSAISYQLTPLRTMLLLRKIALFTKNPIYILGVFIMKLIEATGMLIGFLTRALHRNSW